MSLDGTPPYDGYEVDTIHQNHLALIIIYDIVAFFGLIFVAVCLVFNIVFRNKKSVTGYCTSYFDSLHYIHNYYSYNYNSND